MKRLFLEDTYLYKTIKNTMGWTDADEDKIEPVFVKISNQDSWTIDDIEREARALN